MDARFTLTWLLVLLLGIPGCRLNPHYWPGDHYEVAIKSDKTFYFDIAPELLKKLGGPESEQTRQFITEKLKERGCGNQVHFRKSEPVWNGVYWQITGTCG